MPLFFILAAIPAALTVQFGVSVCGYAVMDHLDRRRLARLMKTACMVGLAGADNLDQAVRTAFEGKGLGIYEPIEIGGTLYGVTGEQRKLLHQLLEQGDDEKLIILLAKIALQTPPAA